MEATSVYPNWPPVLTATGLGGSLAGTDPDHITFDPDLTNDPRKRYSQRGGAVDAIGVMRLHVRNAQGYAYLRPHQPQKLLPRSDRHQRRIWAKLAEQTSYYRHNYRHYVPHELLTDYLQHESPLSGEDGRLSEWQGNGIAGVDCGQNGHIVFYPTGQVLQQACACRMAKQSLISWTQPQSFSGKHESMLGAIDEVDLSRNANDNRGYIVSCSQRRKVTTLFPFERNRKRQRNNVLKLSSLRSNADDEYSEVKRSNTEQIVASDSPLDLHMVDGGEWTSLMGICALRDEVSLSASVYQLNSDAPLDASLSRTLPLPVDAILPEHDMDSLIPFNALPVKVLRRQFPRLPDDGDDSDSDVSIKGEEGEDETKEAKISSRKRSRSFDTRAMASKLLSVCDPSASLYRLHRYVVDELKTQLSSSELLRILQSHREFQVRNKTKVVLEEEEYVEALGQIIERDFFPDLPDLKRQTALLRGDEGETPLADMTLRAVSRRGSASVRSNASGMGWDDPTPNPEPAAGDEEEEETKSEATGAMTLNAFVATHTSEDNESFNELQKKTVKEHQRRYHWAFDDDKEKGDPKLHLLTDGTWISKERRQIADDACAPKGLKDSRPVVPESWRYRARNPLLFPPELEATRDICRVEARGNQLLLENGPKSRLGRPPKAKKKTVYANSRFPAEEKLPSGADAGHGNSTPLKDYSLVPMTPLIAPGIDASPLMTWGDIEGTPMILGSRATPERILNTPTFEVKDTSRRENLVASVLDERPELDPPESIKNTFLENARAHESAKCLSGIGTATANLTKIGSFLNYVGACIIKEIEDNASDTSKCLLSTAATKFEALENGLIRVEAKSTDGSGETTVFHTEHLVLAMGGVQELPSLDNQAYHSKLFTADACLREDGFMKLKEHLLAQPVGERKVCIVGGSHSSFSVAWLLLTKFADVKGAAKAQSLITLDSSANPASVEDQTKFTEGSEATPVVPPSAPIAPVAPSTSMSPLIVTKCETPSVKVKRASVTKATIEPPVSGSTIFKPKDIIILHRSPIRCYYATKKEAEADGVDGSRADRAGCVNTFTGLREDAKKLFKNVIAGRELRIRLLQVKQNGSQAIIDKAYATASAIVWGAGYKTNVLPGFDEAGKSLEFLQDSGVIKLDNKARLQLLGDRQGKSPSVLGVGLGYSLRSSVDEMGSETRVDGVTIYHRRGASLVLEALLGPEVYGTSTSFEEMVEKNEKKRRNILAAKAEKAEK
ncbi:E3 ubiquitin-protein ligase arih2 [Phytophthora boehmeriae]|uniref:E3 ubiquitin-protein ligase arih2 n=1 Tax=Phytophthora boehmeriae TaxID=109152 RepID=A0A8T1WW42_9STRA|nr:E3 ubiquitin-protein ligase arih2 [Phytophthora boehmeriae]